MKNKLIFLLLLVVSFSEVYSQEEETILRNEIKFTGLWGGTINDFINVGGELDVTFGGSLAIEINQNFLIGYSIYGSRFTMNTKNDHLIQMYDLLLGYTFNSDKAIHPVAYLRTGGGSLRGPGFIIDGIFALQPSLGLEANITRIMRIGASVGYRMISNIDAPEIDKNHLSSPYIGVRLKFGFSWDDSH